MRQVEISREKFTFSPTNPMPAYADRRPNRSHPEPRLRRLAHAIRPVPQPARRPPG